MKLQFLDQNEAAREFYATEFFDKMNRQEIAYKFRAYCGIEDDPSNMSLDEMRQVLRSCYIKKVEPWTLEEKKVHQFFMDRTHSILMSKLPGLIPIAPIKMIKMGPKVEFDCYHTIEHDIVCPVDKVAFMIDTYNAFMAGDRSDKFKLNFEDNLMAMSHEIVHIIQRNDDLYPRASRLFNSIYVGVWGFTPIVRSQLDFSDVNWDSMPMFMANPDGYNLEWVVFSKGRYWMPSFADEMDGLLWEVIPKSTGLWHVTNNLVDISSDQSYLNRFYGKNDQTYHPNEIMAVLLCEYIVLDKKYNVSPSNGLVYRLLDANLN